MTLKYVFVMRKNYILELTSECDVHLLSVIMTENKSSIKPEVSLKYCEFLGWPSPAMSDLFH